MTRRVILHTGSPKSGSTFLQNALLQSQGALREAGIHYPHSDDTTHPGNAADIRDITREQLEAFFAGGIHTLVLSHEDLFAIAPDGDALGKLAAEDGTHVDLLVFMRPFSEFIFGDYSQFMKQNFHRYLAERNPYDGRSLEEMARRRSEKMRPTIFFKRWRRRFKDCDLTIASRQEIVPTMERLLGADAPIDWSVGPGRTNPSLRMVDCEAIADAMRDPEIDNDTILDMYRAAYQTTHLPDAGRNAERAAWLEEMFVQQNKALMDQFGFDNRLKVDAEG